MQTVPATAKRSPVARFGSSFGSSDLATKWAEEQTNLPRWASHGLKTPQPVKETKPPQQEEITISLPTAPKQNTASTTSNEQNTTISAEELAAKVVKQKAEAAVEASPQKTEVKEKKPRRQLRPRKALITLTDSAVDHLRALLDQPEPQLIRIGVKNRGCSGLTYHLEYVNEAGKFDETVEQNGVKVLIDSKALFSIVGSEMDWLDDKLSQRFVFKNPNSKGTCGCGESFMV